MSNLTTRILSSIAFVVLILGPLFITDKRFAFVVYAILGALTLKEVVQMLKKTGTAISIVSSGLIYGLLVAVVYNLYFLTSTLSVLVLGLSIVVLAISVLELFESNKQPFERISTSIWMPVYVASSFLGITYFLIYRSDLPSVELTISLFILIWINDSAAYLVGRKIGKTKLFERLSPNKTWEGSISGLIASILCAVGLSFYAGMPSWPVMIGFGFTCVVFGSLGDLLESRIKRAAKVKDSGKFLPGHGGFFDRFDAMMLAVPATILYFEIVFPK